MGLEFIKHHVYPIVKAAEELKGITGQRRLAHGLKVSVEASPGKAHDAGRSARASSKTCASLRGNAILALRCSFALSPAAPQPGFLLGTHGSLLSCQLGQDFVDFFDSPTGCRRPQLDGLGQAAVFGHSPHLCD